MTCTFAAPDMTARTDLSWAGFITACFFPSGFPHFHRTAPESEMCGWWMCPAADTDPQEILWSADWRGGLPPKICGCGLMQNINSILTLGKLTHLAQWADASHPPWPCSAAAAINCTSVTQPHSDGLDTWCCSWASVENGSKSEPWTCGLTVDPRQHLPADADLWSKSADWCGRNTSGCAQLWSECCMPVVTLSMEWANHHQPLGAEMK